MGTDGRPSELPALERQDPYRHLRDRWLIVGNLSSLAAILAAHYLHGRAAVICVVVLGTLFGVSFWLTHRYSPGPFRTRTSLTR